MRKFGLLLFALPLLGGQCDGQEFTWHNQQYIWVRCNTTVSEDSVVIVRGRITDTVALSGDRLYFVESACEAYSDWPENTQCLQSRITLFLKNGVEYDIVGWTEPLDRRTPVRDMTVLQSAWTCCD